jgi:glutaredoxin
LPALRASQGLLDEHGIVYEEVPLGKGITFSTIRAVSGRGTAPQVFIGGRHIGGAEDLERHLTAERKLAA